MTPRREPIGRAILALAMLALGFGIYLAGCSQCRRSVGVAMQGERGAQWRP